MPNIVFLDFDGVVACLEETGGASQPFSRHAVANLNALCAAWDAVIVATSAWRWSARLPGDTDPDAAAAAARFFLANGVTAPLFPGEWWAVPELWQGGDQGLELALRARRRHGVALDGLRATTAARGDEVQVWLDHFLPGAAPEQWLLLDDEDDYWPEQRARLVQTDALRGYDAAAHRRAMALAGPATAAKAPAK